MLVIRPAETNDLSDLLEMAARSGSGLTTLPNDRQSLLEKIQLSELAFVAEDALEQKYSYLLVLHDTETDKVVGTAGIISGVGLDRPFYSYRILQITQASIEPQLRVDTSMLQLSNDYVGAMEIATLYLDESYRSGYLGRFLARSRYLLIAANKDRFPDKVISEVRGWVDEHNQSPFWDAVGRHFFDMDFSEADLINGQGNSQFISDLMPKFPIYTALLPEKAQEVIGKPHDNARGAIHLLEAEGFMFAGAVDIFDAGPALEARRDNLKTISGSVRGVFAGAVTGNPKEAGHMVSNCRLDGYRCVMSPLVETDSGLWLPEAAASALKVEVGDELNYVALPGKQKTEVPK